MGRPTAKKLSNLAELFFEAGREAATASEPTIIEFCEAKWGLNLKLYPAQRVFLKAHYGLALDTKEKVVKIRDWHGNVLKILTEAEYLEHLYDDGRCNIREVIPGEQKRVLLLAVGRRSGKSLMTSCIMAYETYLLLKKGNPQKYYGLAEGATIQLIAVATDKDQAGLLYQSVASHFAHCDFFKGFAANQTMSYARFQTPHDIEKFGRWSPTDTDRRASITITFRSCVAKGLRGAGNLLFSLDEIAHFAENNGQGSADAVYTALAPSVATFSPKDHETREPCGEGEGRQIMISSPLGRSGFFYEHFQLGFQGGGAAKNMLCIQAPTWEVNPTVDTDFLETQFRKDPDSFFVEFGAEFSHATKGWITDQRDLLAVIDQSARPSRQGPSRRPHFIGLDIGLSGDGSAAAIGHITRDGLIVLDYLEWIKAGEGDYADLERLDFDGIGDWIEDLAKRFYIKEGIFDQWAGIPLQQALTKRGLRQMVSVPFTQTLNSNVYKNFKNMMWDDRLVLFDYPIPEGKEHCGYIDELFTLEETKVSKNISKVEAPNLDNYHDDRSDALARMIWLCSNNLSNPKAISKGTSRRPRGDVNAPSRFARGRTAADPGLRQTPRQMTKGRQKQRGPGRGRGPRGSRHSLHNMYLNRGDRG